MKSNRNLIFEQREQHKITMSQPANFILPTEEKFDGSNWIEWKESIISAAKSRGVMGYLEGTIQRPTTPSPSTNPSHTPLPVTPTVYCVERVATK
jgi:hypothetical protein